MTKFKAFRRRCGLSQEQIAEKLRISQSQWSLIETGKYRPSDDVRDRMLEAFGEDAVRPLFDSVETSSDVIGQLRNAWENYTEVRNTFEFFVGQIVEAATALHPFQNDLDATLEVVGRTSGNPKAVHLKTYLDRLIGKATIENSPYLIPPRKHAHPNFAALKKIPLSQDRFERIESLLEIVDRLENDDLRLLAQIADRLCDKHNAQEQRDA